MTAPDPWKKDVDELKQEIKDLRTVIGSLVEGIEVLKKVKLEGAAPGAPLSKVEVKREPLEALLGTDFGEVLAPAETEDAPDNEFAEVTRNEQEQLRVDGGPGDASQGTRDADEQIACVPSRRQTTEEPVWATPSCEEVFFRVNPEYVQRIAATNGVVAPPVQVPTPPPQPREETPPPPPRPPPPPPATRPTKAIGIIPASQAKRKHDFELIIEIPAKRFKASHYPTPTSSSSGSVASSSRTTLDTGPVVVAAHPLSKPTRYLKNTTIRKVSGTTFTPDIDPEIRNVVVTREFLRSQFGAHPYHIFSQPPVDKVHKHGYDHFAFIHGDATPQAPSAPGRPGLVTLFDERPWPVYRRYRIFVRIQVLPARWQYMGMYKATKLSAWTPEEIKSQRVAVRWYWSVLVRESRWALPILARITLREEFGREPTTDEIDDQVQKLKKRSVPLPSLHTIMGAFERGEEKLYPWKLDCEDYENNLQWEIALTFPSFEEGKANKSNASADA